MNEIYNSNGWLHVHAIKFSNKNLDKISETDKPKKIFKVEEGNLESITNEQIEEISPIDKIEISENAQKYIENQEFSKRLQEKLSNESLTYNNNRQIAINAYQKNMKYID